MPAYCTHYIFACELLPALTEPAGFDLNRDAVMLGTQGPDVFFFHRIAPWMPGRSQRKIGSRLHRAKPGDILDAMAEYCTRCSTKKDIARSYAYGFILHYALDRQCHPFVYAKQQELADSVNSTARALIADRAAWEKQITDLLHRHLFSYGQNGAPGVTYILTRLRDIQTARKQAEAAARRGK